jgi:hypothetical protein
MSVVSLYRRFSEPSRVGRKRLFRPALEALEERLVPASATITVTNLTDTVITGETNLRQAINEVNTSTNATTFNIVFANSGTIRLTEGELAIDPKNAKTVVSITGAAGGDCIDAGGHSRIERVSHPLSPPGRGDDFFVAAP